MGKEIELANKCFKGRFDNEVVATKEVDAYYWFLLGWRDRSTFKEELE